MAKESRDLPFLESGRTRFLTLGAVAFALVLFTGVVAAVTLHLRGRLRDQIIARDAAVLYPVVQMQLQNAATDSLWVQPEEDLITVVLEVSRLRGVVAMRLFSPEGELIDAIPLDFVAGDITAEDLRKLWLGNPVSHFLPEARLQDFFFEPPAEGEPSPSPIPLLEVLTPLHSAVDGQLLGIAHFLINGQPIAEAFVQLDKSLLRQAFLAILAGVVPAGALLALAFLRLNRSNQLLAIRSKELQHANADLCRAAKFSALGAVTAHLVHGLKNPLASLRTYVSSQAGVEATGGDEQELANEAANRMHSMIQETVGVLTQEEKGESFDFSLREISDAVLEKASPMAQVRGVLLESYPPPNQTIDNRRGNLLALAALNLVQNAIEATPAGGTVRIDWPEDSEDETVLLIADTGHGLPLHVRDDPFRPQRSSKEGGTGIGLAITNHLVQLMGGNVALQHSDAEGAVFRISFRNDVPSN